MANAYPNIVAIQMTSSPLVEDNLLFVEQQLKLLPTQTLFGGIARMFCVFWW